MPANTMGRTQPVLKVSQVRIDGVPAKMMPDYLWRELLSKARLELTESEVQALIDWRFSNA